MSAGFVAPLLVAQADGTALTNTTPTSIVPGRLKPILNASFIDTLGKSLWLKIFGKISTAATPGTFQFDVKASSVIIATSGALTLIASKTNVYWELEVELTARLSEPNVQFMYGGKATSEAFGSSGTAGQANVVCFPNPPAVGNTIDPTGAQQLDVFGTWSTAPAGSSITVNGGRWILPN